MENINVNQRLDAKGLSCPMPIVKTKKAMTELEFGQVIEIQATDKGSKADLKAWADRSGNQYLGTIDEDGVLKHYLRKSSNEEMKNENKHPHTISNEELITLLEKNNQTVIVLDVRESAEYAFGHIPGAVSIPLGELKDKSSGLNKEAEIYVICRTGSRSDLAAQMLAKNGFEKVFNVVPGMSEWNEKAEGI